jgi:serine protease AprX
LPQFVLFCYTLIVSCEFRGNAKESNVYQMKKFVSAALLYVLLVQSASAGILFVRSSGITLTGADGITLTGADGITLTGADGIINYTSNGITLTGADGITLTGADTLRPSGTNGTTYTGPNGITLTGADGITLTGADGITLTGADGITLTGADGTRYTADSIVARRPNGITLTGADGTAIVGADGITLTGADGITLTGADGITLTGADGITLTGADSIVGFGPAGVAFTLVNPDGITLTGADGITLTGADGITLTGADGITLTGADGITLTGADGSPAGIQGLDPDLAIQLNNATDDSNINAVIVYHQTVNSADLDHLRQLGIVGGTLFRRLPMVYVSATRQQLIAVSHFPEVRSLYGNRTLNFNSDPYFNATGVQRVSGDADLRADNNGLPFTGRNVTVAVLDTGINATHPDLAGRVLQNVKLVDPQSVPATFIYPQPIEDQINTDLASGHGTFVSGIIAGNGSSSSGRYAGVAPGARLLGLSAGDVDLTNVLSGFDYLLEKAAIYNVRVVNCSFSAATVYDPNDPVNVATKILTDSGVNVVFSAGNSGSGNGTLNPYAAAPWVISVGATDDRGRLAAFSSRGYFGDPLQHPTLVAPGVNVISLRSAAGTTGVIGAGGADTSRLALSDIPFYTTASGTSFSAPQVAAAVALMLEADPELRPAKIKEILSRTATPTPKYFYHEAGAGMLNTYSAVLQSAFPERHMGVFRSVLSQNQIRFVTSSPQQFTAPIYTGAPTSVNFSVPANTVQASVSISWNLGPNDFGLKVFDSANSLTGESNYLNLPGLTGRREKVSIRSPQPQTYRAAIQHSAGTGTMQNVHGVVELTRVEYPDLVDMSTMPQADLTQAYISLLTNAMLQDGRRFRPMGTVSRADLAGSFVRAGCVPQYLAANAIFTDVRDITTRNLVESAQANPEGKLFYDAVAGGRFRPYDQATRLVAAVALVRGAGLSSEAASAALPLGMADALSIPTEWRGYVAVALQRGFLSLDGNSFFPSRALSRLELARAMNAVINR